MSTVIYYFSSTGNSLVVAKDIANGLGDAKLVPMTQGMKQVDALTYDRVGFVYPVYMFGLPLVVADLLKTIKIRYGAYVFSVATFGGLQGRPHSLAKEILEARGIKLACGFSVLMPGNYTPLYGAIAEEKQKEMFTAQKIRTQQIIECLSQRKSNAFEEKPFLLNFLLYALLYKGGSTQIRGAAKGFWTTEACIKCGLCAKVCPVQNINMVDGKPLWAMHCEHCLACLQWCPSEAIQYKKSTLGKKRYHHPSVSAKDIMP